MPSLFRWSLFPKQPTLEQVPTVPKSLPNLWKWSTGTGFSAWGCGILPDVFLLATLLHPHHYYRMLSLTSSPHWNVAAPPKTAHFPMLLPITRPGGGIGCCCFQVLIPSSPSEEHQSIYLQITVTQLPPGHSSSFTEDLQTWLILFLWTTSRILLSLNLYFYFRYPILWLQFSILPAFSQSRCHLYLLLIFLPSRLFQPNWANGRSPPNYSLASIPNCPVPYSLL